MFFLAQPKASNLELELSERLLIVPNSLKFRFPFGQQMVAKMRFWLLERSMSTTKASLLVMILKSVLQYSLLITRPCFTREATSPLAPVERSFLLYHNLEF